MQSTAKSFFIKTTDDHTIGTTLYQSAAKGNHLIIIASAAGAPQGYYQGFAEFASQYVAFDAVTFDYRSIGKSKFQSTKTSKAVMSDWGRFDMQAIIEWASDKYEKIFVLGHSVAGQVYPFAESRNRISAAYFVASQSAYRGYWHGFEKFKVLLFWYLVIPLMIKSYGYLPGWVMGGKISLPKGVAREWRSWGMDKFGYFASDPNAADKFNDVRMPVHFVALSDDKLFGPSEAVQALMKRYGNSKTSFQFIRPEDLGLRTIGHFGFFRSKYQEKLWSMPIYYFTQFLNQF